MGKGGNSLPNSLTFLEEVMKRYKIYNSYYNKKEWAEKLIDDLIKPMVRYTQHVIKIDTNIEFGEHEDYRGLCDKASSLFNAHILSMVEPHRITVKTIHGELKHDSRIHSHYWYHQHTMSLITIDGIKFYVDTTCKQFRDLYAEMPDYYIGTKRPSWFYPDYVNPVFATKLGLWIDNHIKVTHKYDKHMYYNFGIISYMQYIIHGRISDKIHKIKYE